MVYPSPNFNGEAVDVWELINHFVPHYTGFVISYRCWDSIVFVKGTPGVAYTWWKRVTISLVTSVCVANPSFHLLPPRGENENSVKPGFSDNEAPSTSLQETTTTTTTTKTTTTTTTCRHWSPRQLQPLRGTAHLWPLLQTWINFNPGMDK